LQTVIVVSIITDNPAHVWSWSRWYRKRRRGRLMRAGRGVYVRPIEGKYGARPPSAAMLVRTMGQQRGETVTLHGAAAANALGLTTQLPVREIAAARSRLPTWMAQEVSALAVAHTVKK
jgi:hypothetical protein